MWQAVAPILLIFLLSSCASPMAAIRREPNPPAQSPGTNTAQTDQSLPTETPAEPLTPVLLEPEEEVLSPSPESESEPQADSLAQLSETDRPQSDQLTSTEIATVLATPVAMELEEEDLSSPPETDSAPEANPQTNPVTFTEAPVTADYSSGVILLSPKLSIADSSSLTDSRGHKLEAGELAIVIDGADWVFRSDLSTPGPWVFLFRERKPGSVDFYFNFSEKGSWSLVFDQQDLSGRDTRREYRTIHVNDKNQISILKDARMNAEDLTPAPGISDNAKQRHKVASQAVLSGEYDQAMKLWAIDAREDTPEGAKARESIVREAAQSKSLPVLVTWLSAYLKDGADPQILEQAFLALKEPAGYQNEMLAVLEELTRLEGNQRSSEWLYQLALILEKPGQQRDLHRAAGIYQKIIDDWPISRWREKAEERLLWLKRQYFRVR